jgi:hypothetical protein
MRRAPDAHVCAAHVEQRQTPSPPPGERAGVRGHSARNVPVARLFLGLFLALLSTGCASRCVRDANNRPFAFGRDTFSYRNDLVWEYVFDDAAGKTSHRARDPKPDYTHHCFVVARSSRQFFQYAQFDPSLPVADDETYRKLINEVVARDPMWCHEKERIVIPGFTNLYDFSVRRSKLLQEECGGAWRSYFQRGHWRIMFPFWRTGQAKEAEWLIREIRNHRPPVVHLVRFPQLTINHAIVLFDVTETAEEIEFSAYDPYEPNRPVPLTFNRKTRTFRFPRHPYYIGGEVNVYEVYRTWYN